MTHQEIINGDIPSLKSFIEYWKDYKSNYVLIAYAELNKRNYQGLDNRFIKKLNEFSLKFNHSDIDSFLTAFLLENDCNNYEEFLLKIGISSNNNLNDSQSQTSIKEVDRKYDNYDVKDILIEILNTQKENVEKLELVRENTAKLVWWLIAIPIIISILYILFFLIVN